jgi:hypothetical protein
MQKAIMVCVALLTGCGTSYEAPVRITLDDGLSFTICSGSVQIIKDIKTSVPSYTVKADRFFYGGAERVSIEKIPPRVPLSKIPEFWPDPIGDRDADGQPFSEGVVYKWDSGFEAELKNGEWRIVVADLPNPECMPEKAFKPSKKDVNQNADFRDLAEKSSTSDDISFLFREEFFDRSGPVKRSPE